MFVRKFLAVVLLVGILFSQSAIPLAAAKACDQAQFISDLTAPDGTSFSPGATFTKTWRLMNIGSCTWSESYTLTFFSGEQFGVSASLKLPVEVTPGRMVDISVNMTAPKVSGHYRGYWKLNNPYLSGGPFGIGSTGSDPFWVDINVLETSAIIYDFVANAPYAEWKSGAGILPYPGTSGDSRGYSYKLDYPRLENDSIDSLPGLLTVPQNKYNGYIQATYPEFLVSAGDHLQSLVNCEFSAADCYVTFRVDYINSKGSVKEFWKWKETYDGRFYRTDLDLSSLAGQKVRFIFMTLSTGVASGDRAVWGAPRIVRTSSEVPPVSPATLTPLPPLTPTLTPFVTAPAVLPSGCDKASFVADVTVPDGTLFSPGSAFTKTWRIKNIGSCAWTTSYSLIYYSGERMDAPTALNMPSIIGSGQTVDLSLNMTAPVYPGKYRGYWILRNSSGMFFGLGTKTSMPFWIEINVTGSPTTSAGYDFAANVCSAEWRSGAGLLPCPGLDNDKNGFVIKMDSTKLEDGTLNALPSLLVAPQNKYNGYIQGFYPTFTVQPGDRFRTTVGCEYATSCYVSFKLDYMTATGTVTNFWTWREQNEGRPNNIDLDLTPLVGRSVRFILTLLANGSAANDRAVWSAPTIVRTTYISPTLTPTPSPTPQVNDWLTYTNSTYGFQFKYPKSAQITDLQENSISMILPITPGTNLNQKRLQVIAVENLNPCSSTLGRYSMLNSSEIVLINGISFLKETGGDNAAGQIHQWVAYSTTQANVCLVFDFVLHITNPGNYTTPPPIFNEAAEIAVLKDMVSTFTWLGATPTSTFTPTPTFAPTPISFDWPTYANSKYGFQLKYPKEAQLTIQNDNAAQLLLPFATGTNLKEKSMDIIVREDLNPCRSLVASSSMLASSETVTINGIPFLKEIGEDGATGSLYQWVAYSTVKGNACISLELLLHSINPGVYPTPPPVFDYAIETSVIKTMIETFGWSPATLTPTPTLLPAPVFTLSAIVDALNARNYGTLKASMGEIFAVSFWQSEGLSYTPDEAIEQLKSYYLGASAQLTPNAAKDLTAMLGGLNPYSIMGLDPAKSQALFVSGWGLDAKDEAILYLTQRSDGSLYWHGILVAKGGFVTNVPLKGPYAVVNLGSNDVLNIRSGAGDSQLVVGYYARDATDVMRTGPATTVDGAEWVEIRKEDGLIGWVNSFYLTEYVTHDAFCADARIPVLIEQVKQSMIQSNRNLLASSVSPVNGVNMHLWAYASPVNFTQGAAQGIFTSAAAYNWGGGPSGLPDIGAFKDVVQPKYLEVFNAPNMETYCDDLTKVFTLSKPWPYQNIHFYNLYKPATSDTLLDFRTLLIGVEYVNGQPYLYGMVTIVWEP